MRTIVFTGDSHLGALRKALRNAVDKTRYSAIHFWPLGKGGEATKKFFEVSKSSAEISTKGVGWKNRVFSRESLLAVGAEPVLIVSMPLNTSRILRDVSWNTHHPWPVGLIDGSVSISDAFVDEIIFEDCMYSVDFVRELKEIGIDVIVLEAPRFFKNANYLEKYPFEVCRFVDARYRDVVSGLLLDSGIPIIGQPATTVTELGTTHLKFDHPNPKDNHHANAEYGAIILDEVIAQMEMPR